MISSLVARARERSFVVGVILVFACLFSTRGKIVVAREIELKVMTFNVWNSEDNAVGRQAIVTAIRQSGADLIGLQEMGSSPLKSVAQSLGYYDFDQRMGSEAILSRYRVVDTAPQRFGVQLELAPGHRVWLFNTHLYHAPYGPYQLNGITYNGGKLYDPSDPSQISQVIADQVAARGREVSQLLSSVADSESIDSGTPVFLTGDFNEPSFLDWTSAAVDAGVHVAEVEWPASRAIVSAGFNDSWRVVYPDEVMAPGRTWSPVYPPGYLNRGDNPRGQVGPVPEPQDRIDLVYYSGAEVTPVMSARSGPLGRDETEDYEQAGYPSDHNAVTSTFLIGGMDDTVLDFFALGENGEMIPAYYGNRVLSSPDVSLDWRTLGDQAERASWQFAAGATHNNGAARLAFDDSAGQVSQPLTYAIQLSTPASNRVQLDSFTLLNESITATADASVAWEIWQQDKRLDHGTILLPTLGERSSVLLPKRLDSAELELRLQIDAAHANGVAIDDLVFRQLSVPEPRWGMILPALISLLVFARGPQRGQSF